MTDWFGVIRRALHPLEAPPAPPAWNHDHLLDLLGEGPRADAAVLMAIRDVPDPRVVFTLRRDDLVRHAGQVSFPGGRTDHGDAGAIGTALRESHEEVGLDPDAAEPLGFLDCLETISGFCVTPVVARMTGDAVLTPEPGEVAKIFEVPLAFLLEPANQKRHFRMMGEVRRDYWAIPYAERYIWGATAAMLMMFDRVLREGAGAA